MMYLRICGYKADFKRFQTVTGLRGWDRIIWPVIAAAPVCPSCTGSF